MRTAVQDGGAASFLGSKPKVVEYLKFLIERGVNPNDVEVYRCNKGFKHGNSQRESTDLGVVMPMFVAGKTIKGALLRHWGQHADPHGTATS